MSTLWRAHFFITTNDNGDFIVKNTSQVNLKSVYAEKDDFIIIGLTGWTGSGCSTVADILAKSNFRDIKLPDVNILSGNEKRKSLIVNNFISQNWKGFFRLRLVRY